MPNFRFQVASLRDKLKSEALNNPFTGPSEIVSAVKANYSAEVIQAIPSDETLLWNIRRMRAARGVGSDPKSNQEIN